MNSVPACANCEHRVQSALLIIEPGLTGVGICVHYDEVRGTETWMTRNTYWCPLHKWAVAATGALE